VDYVFLSVFAFLAGFVDAIAGGGGLIQLPALFLFVPASAGVPVATLLGTNKLSSICGTSMAALQYARRVPIPWHSVLPGAIAAFGLSMVGAWFVTWLSPAVLKPLVVLLLLAVAIFTFINKGLGQHQRPTPLRHQAVLYAIALGAGIGFYDGFFGPGTGSFLILAFIGIFGFDFLTASASAKIINFATNLSATIYFAATDHILLRFAVPMAICNVLGSILGARLAILRGNQFIRRLFLAVILLLILRLAWDLLSS
jgi:uncharacterized membrane protein YfcA